MRSRPVSDPSATPPAHSHRGDGAARHARNAKTVKVVFTLPAGIDADEVALCGEFNAWSNETKLTRNGDGSWYTMITVPPGVYRCRYLLDGTRWETARDADGYVANRYGRDDSLIIVVGD